MTLRQLSDDDLVDEARAGSDAAFAALYVRYQRAVQARCFAVLRDHDEAADAAQNAMISALRALRRNGSPTHLRGWLLSIAHNEAVSLLRRSRPAEPLEDGHAAAAPGADEGAFDRERLRQLVEDLNALPDRQRGALLLREASGYSYRRIATAMGTSTGNARQTVHQARRNMRKRRVGREHGWLGFALPGLAGAWMVRVLGLEELAANVTGVGKAALLAGALVAGGGAASQLEAGGALLGAAAPPRALASAPRAQALAALPRRLGEARAQPSKGVVTRRPAATGTRTVAPALVTKSAEPVATRPKPKADPQPAIEPVASKPPAQQPGAGEPHAVAAAAAQRADCNRASQAPRQPPQPPQPPQPAQPAPPPAPQPAAPQQPTAQ